MTDFVRDQNKTRLKVGDKIMRPYMADMTGQPGAFGKIKYIKPSHEAYTTPGDHMLTIEILHRSPYHIIVSPESVIKIPDEKYDEAVVLLKLTGII